MGENKKEKRVDFLKNTLEAIYVGELPYNKYAENLVKEWIEDLEEELNADF